MIDEESGFTLLEMMVVVMLLAVVARMVVTALPSPANNDALEPVRFAARWASEQAQLEGRFWRLQIYPSRWQLSVLQAGHGDEPGPFPETQWSPVNNRLAAGTLAAGEFDLPGAAPLTVWFLPDGDITATDLVWRAEDGQPHRLVLSSAALFAQATP
ncbi:hypothetical protein CIG19_12915 [Enterobacterales bacterium CwR94]|nr:hypothetical protein CIG19_12915 [Enterobacterales bacterium CwR94]